MKGAGLHMKRLFLLEDDLSLINGLTFAVKNRDMKSMLPAPRWERIYYGKTENMIW